MGFKQSALVTGKYGGSCISGMVIPGGKKLPTANVEKILILVLLNHRRLFTTAIFNFKIVEDMVLLCLMVGLYLLLGLSLGSLIEFSK